MFENISIMLGLSTRYEITRSPKCYIWAS